MRIIAADTGIPYDLNVGDSVELIGSIRPYNGGKIVHGPDTGHIMDIRDKVERLAIKWQQARFGGWYDAKDLAQVATLQTPNTTPQKTNPAPSKPAVSTPGFQVGARVQAGQAIYSPSCGVTVGKGTAGSVVWAGRQSVSVRWDNGPEFVYVNPALLVPSSGQAPQSVSSHQSPSQQGTSQQRTLAQPTPLAGQERQRYSEGEMLMFQSIQELLIALGFSDDQKTGEMRNPQTAHAISFSAIAGRSVGQFVRQGVKAGWLNDYLKPDAAHDLAA